MPKPLRGGAARARRRGAYASAHGEQQGVPKHLQPAHYLVSGSWVGSHRGLGILICDSWGRRPPRCRRRCVRRSHTLLQDCMCCFADTHLPMPEADKPRGTTVPELNDKTLPPRHLGSHKADDEGDVTRPLPLAMLTYQHTRGATFAHSQTRIKQRGRHMGATIIKRDKYHLHGRDKWFHFRQRPSSRSVDPTSTKQRPVHDSLLWMFPRTASSSCYSSPAPCPCGCPCVPLLAHFLSPRTRCRWGCRYGHPGRGGPI